MFSRSPCESRALPDLVIPPEKKNIFLKKSNKLFFNKNINDNNIKRNSFYEKVNEPECRLCFASCSSFTKDIKIPINILFLDKSSFGKKRVLINFVKEMRNSFQFTF